MSMDPVYRYMKPYPYQTGHMDFRPSYYPRSEAAPPHMYIAPTRPPVNCEQWPLGSNYGYAYPPVACHGCCNYSHMPNHYSWRPPYSHVPPAYAPTGYPPFLGEYMPPYYHMEHPQFVYEKNMPRDHHCCGCPNHLHSQKEQKNVNIEEEEPERGLKKDAPVAPFKFKNSPYPLMWMPIESGNNNEHQKDLKDGSGNAKPHYHRKTDEKHPGTGFGWHPFNSIKSGSPGEKEENKISTHESDDGKGRLPFPVFWMPYMPKEQEKEEPDDRNVTNSNQLESVKSGSPREKEENRMNCHESEDGKGRLPFPVFWMPYMPKEQEKEEPKEGSVADSRPPLEPVKNSGEQTDRHAVPAVKDIPVKEVKSNEESAISQIKEGMKDSSHRDGNSAGEKLAKDNPKKGPSSPTKTSKLPPVCLRVDPLPRRKNTNGKSRSPSPPGDKQKADQPSDGSRIVISSINHEETPQVTTNEGKGTTKDIKVADGSTCQEEHTRNQIKVEHNKEKASVECNKSGEAVRPGFTLSTGGQNEEISSDKEVVAYEVKEQSTPTMSEDQAAVIIQSVYRGFVIRRWEPVKKLKQIARVREKMAEVNGLIQAMESSSHVQGNDKQRAIISETIMSLLLELDTIQGLHESIREVRKSVVRELVALQEKLDAVIIDKAKASEGQKLAARCDENASKGTERVSSQGNNEAQPGLVEPCPKAQLDGKTFEASEISKEPAEEHEIILGSETAKIENCTSEDSKPAVEPIFVEEVQASQPQVLGDDTKRSSSDGVIDSLAKGDELHHETTELPNEVSDDHYKHLEEEEVSRTKASSIAMEDQVMRQETKCSSNGMTESVVNGDEARRESTEQPKEDSQCTSGKEEVNQAKQLDGLLIGENSSELNQDVPLDEAINSHVTETNPVKECTEKKSDDEFGIAKQVQNATENENEQDEPDKCFAQSPKTVSTNMYEPLQAYLETEHFLIETSNGEEADNILQEVSPITEKEKDMLAEKELDAKQEASTVTPDTDAAATMIEEELKSGDDIVVSDHCSGEHQHLPVENEANFAHEVEKEPEIVSVVPIDGPEAERDEKLIEENERLRDMVEKLVQSSQEQLRVISSLSGRVKDLERNLSKKRKVKVKPHRGNKRSGSLEDWTDGVTV